MIDVENGRLCDSIVRGIPGASALPGFEKDHWPNMADRTWGAEVSTYYGAKPYWE
jgi:hypothetical protein